MAGAADKARFHLEQSVPELREWERREIFTRAEISAIARQRSNFEHTIAARGASTPATYARYAAYELNLGALARKRIQRRKLKSVSSASAYAGQKRVLGILERGTRKHHGALELWLQYLEHCRGIGARKRLQSALTECARLFPTRPDVWIWAARWESDTQGDMPAARAWMQRGLRFCPRSAELYVEYARLEMGYVAKIAARRKILGLADSEGADPQLQTQDSQDGQDGQDADELDVAADEIVLPITTAEDFELENDEQKRERRRQSSALDDSTLAKLTSSPALAGAIPEAIVDAAMRHFQPTGAAVASQGAWNALDTLAADFYDMLASFVPSAPCARRLAQHVVGQAVFATNNKTGPAVTSCTCRLPLLGVPVDSPQFPQELRASLRLIQGSQDALQDAKQRNKLNSRLLAWLRSLLSNSGAGGIDSREDNGDGDGDNQISTKSKLAPELVVVLRATAARLEAALDRDGGGNDGDAADKVENKSVAVASSFDAPLKSISA